MVTIHAVADLAHASIPVPPNLAHLGKAWQEVFLRQTADGRFRWFHADGQKTVVEGDSIENAIQVARIIWGDVQLMHG